jgi:hypothetical protein
MNSRLCGNDENDKKDGDIRTDENIRKHGNIGSA